MQTLQVSVSAMGVVCFPLEVRLREIGGQRYGRIACRPTMRLDIKFDARMGV